MLKHLIYHIGIIILFLIFDKLILKIKTHEYYLLYINVDTYNKSIFL